MIKTKSELLSKAFHSYRIDEYKYGPTYFIQHIVVGYSCVKTNSIRSFSGSEGRAKLFSILHSSRQQQRPLFIRFYIQLESYIFSIVSICYVLVLSFLALALHETIKSMFGNISIYFISCIKQRSIFNNTVIYVE